jgi:hypothetical protein
MVQICVNKTSEFCIIAIFKSFVKQNNDTNKTYVHDLLLYQTSLVLVSAMVHKLPPFFICMNINFQQPSIFMFFLFFIKTVLLKVVHPLEIYQHAKYNGPTLPGESFVSTLEV